MAEVAQKHNYNGIFGFFLIILGIFMMGLPIAGLGFTAFGVGLLVIIRSLSLNYLGRYSLWWFSHWSLLALSIIGIGVGILVFISPFFSVIAVGILISIGLVILGVGDIVRGIAPIEVGSNRWIAILTGLLSFLVISFILGATDAYGIIYPTATYAVIVGLLNLVFGVAYGGGEFQRARTVQAAREARERRAPRPRPA
jgi:uncharacterized membrane protein HdeD (DUF308 family)